MNNQSLFAQKTRSARKKTRMRLNIRENLNVGGHRRRSSRKLWGPQENPGAAFSAGEL